MKVSIFSFTEEGKNLENKIKDILSGSTFRDECVDVIAGCKKSDATEAFLNSDALIFIGAAGIAMRIVGPLLKDKLTDPAVIVVDELAQFVIPLASGHVGGANKLSEVLAAKLSAIPVITTATDVEGVFSVDEFAAENHLEIKGRQNIKKVAKKLLRGEAVGIAFEDDVVVEAASKYHNPQESGLYLLMRPYVVGMGCKKGKSIEEIEKFFLETLLEQNVSVKDVTALCTIDVKKDEPAFLQLCEKYNLKLMTYSAKELERVEGEFEESSFVKETVGVSDVSARAAKKYGGEGRFILKKAKKDGMTISVFEKYRRVYLRYE